MMHEFVLAAGNAPDDRGWAAAIAAIISFLSLAGVLVVDLTRLSDKAIAFFLSMLSFTALIIFGVSVVSAAYEFFEQDNGAAAMWTGAGFFSAMTMFAGVGKLGRDHGRNTDDRIKRVKADLEIEEGRERLRQKRLETLELEQKIDIDLMKSMNKEGFSEEEIAAELKRNRALRDSALRRDTRAAEVWMPD